MNSCFSPPKANYFVPKRSILNFYYASKGHGSKIKKKLGAGKLVYRLGNCSLERRCWIRNHKDEEEVDGLLKPFVHPLLPLFPWVVGLECSWRELETGQELATPWRKSTPFLQPLEWIGSVVFHLSCGTGANLNSFLSKSALKEESLC